MRTLPQTMQSARIAVCVAVAAVLSLQCALCVAVKRGDLLVQSPSDVQVWSPTGQMRGSFSIQFSSSYRALAAFSGYAVLLESTGHLQDHQVTFVQFGSSPRVISGYLTRSRYDRQ
jgi:hypothetical protein